MKIIRLNLQLNNVSISTFINSHEHLVEILKQCKKCLKKDGYLFIADFSWVNMN